MVGANVINGLIGGLMIGAASLLLLAVNGRIAGVSGILGGIFFQSDQRERLWRIAFVMGLILGAGFYSLLYGGLPINFQAQGASLAAAGVLVGFGTRLGSGCTSGHAICGLARRSLRSFAATITFMVAAAATVFLARHVMT